MIDWHDIALQPGVARLAAALRAEFGVWVGLVDAEGAAIALGRGVGGRRTDAAAVSLPACEHHKSRSTPARRNPDRTTCAQSIEGWAQQALVGDADAPLELGCHAGLSALVRPIRDRDGQARGAVYASGFVESERAHQTLATIEERLVGSGHESAEAAVDAVPRLDRRDRRFITRLLDGIGDEVERLLGQGQPADGRPGRIDGESFEGMIGGSRSMRQIFEMISRVADTRSTVLIQGENGTGKELIANALHARSGRADHPFVALNCAAIPADLIASELFGHTKGAFSGAHRDRVGLIAEADGGTLFLDEIGDMATTLQVKLLRFLQEGTYAPVGSGDQRRADVRVICATNQDLRELVAQGQFRKDLFFRINVIRIVAPPLRQRREDIELLVDHFLQRAALRQQRPKKQLDEACMAALEAHDWPGNVRELENEIERLVILSGDATTIGRDLLSDRIDASPAEPSFPTVEGVEMPDAVEQLERKMILDALRRTGWNKTQTAKDLGVSRRNLIRKVARYRLEEFRDEG